MWQFGLGQSRVQAHFVGLGGAGFVGARKRSWGHGHHAVHLERLKVHQHDLVVGGCQRLDDLVGPHDPIERHRRPVRQRTRELDVVEDVAVDGSRGIA